MPSRPCSGRTATNASIPPLREARLREVADTVERAIGRRMDLAEIAEGFLRIAVDNMANAIRKISIARGHDVTRYALACFGGAGGQHACRVADSLGIERILVHPLASLLSAYGIGLADVKAIREAGVVKPLSEDYSDALQALEAAATGALVEQGIPADRIELRRRTRLRLSGSDTALEVELADDQAMRADFSDVHRRRFGYVDESGEIILDALIVEAVSHTGAEAVYARSRVPAPSRDYLATGRSLRAKTLRATRGSTGQP